MNLYVDTADVESIERFTRYGILDGVTTNPSIVADDGRSYREVVTSVDAVVDGPVFAQVLAADVDGMVQEGRAYQEWGERVIVKIPATAAGFEALHRLRAAGTPAGITVVFTVEQAVIAAKADATFVAPYVGRMTDAGEDGVGAIERVQSIYDAYGFDTELLAASIRNPRQATECYAAGVDAVTLAPDVLAAHVSSAQTEESTAGFQAAWGDRGSPIE